MAVAALVVGVGWWVDAVSFHGSATVTIAAEGLVLVESYPDGERAMFSRQGEDLMVDPLLWRKGSQLIEWIDQRAQHITVPRERRLDPSPYVTKAVLRARPKPPNARQTDWGLSGSRVGE